MNRLNGRDSELGFVPNHLIVSANNFFTHIPEKSIEVPIICYCLDFSPDVFVNRSGIRRVLIFHLNRRPSFNAVMDF